MAQVRVSGLKEAIAALEPRLARESVFRGVVKWSLGFHRSLVTNTFMTTKGGKGNLARRWFVRPSMGADGISISTGNTARYSGWVEDGTRPHRILPRTKKALRWRTGGRGAVSAFRAVVSLKSAIRGLSGGPGALHKSNFIFSKGVDHPGTQPMKIFQGTFDAEKGDLVVSILDELDASIKAQSIG
jgi:hypothetical protein